MFWQQSQKNLVPRHNSSLTVGETSEINIKMTAAVASAALLLEGLPRCTQNGHNSVKFWPFLSAIGLKRRETAESEAYSEIQNV